MDRDEAAKIAQRIQARVAAGAVDLRDVASLCGEAWDQDLLAGVLQAAAEPFFAEQWRPIEEAPLFTVIDVWIAGLDEDGWRITGQILSAQEPMWFKTEEGGNYWPHENGGYPTHFMPLPAPPVTKGEAR